MSDAEYKPKFAAGDIVTLKGGGPHMTVLNPSTLDVSVVICAWFNDTGMGWAGPYRESFNMDALEPVPSLPQAPDGGC